MSSHAETLQKIREILEREFAPVNLVLEDESHHHAGHAGARGGGGHFYAEITSAKFAGKSPLERQRMVYAVMGKLMEKEIHALSLKCLPA